MTKLCDKMNKLGENSYGGTPSNIPNLEVKPIYADGTWLEAAWESMDLPSSIKRETSVSLSFLFLSKNIYVISLLCDIIKRMNKKEVNNGTIRKIKRI